MKQVTSPELWPPILISLTYKRNQDYWYVMYTPIFNRHAYCKITYCSTEVLLSRVTNIRTGRKRKLQIPGPVDAPFKKLFTPAKGKKGGKGPGRPKEGPLTAIEQWGPKKGSKPKPPYLYKKDSYLKNRASLGVSLEVPGDPHGRDP